MSATEMPSKPFDLDALDKIISETVAPAAEEIDRTGAFPQAALRSLGEAGLLGLVSSRDVGGLGQSHRAATMVVERIAAACASTAMVVCMHYAGTAVIEAHGPLAIREAIAGGRHLTTMAFSEQGSRSHFWAPTSTATQAEGSVRLDAQKSWGLIRRKQALSQLFIPGILCRRQFFNKAGIFNNRDQLVEGA